MIRERIDCIGRILCVDNMGVVTLSQSKIGDKYFDARLIAILNRNKIREGRVEVEYAQFAYNKVKLIGYDCFSLNDVIIKVLRPKKIVIVYVNDFRCREWYSIGIENYNFHKKVKEISNEEGFEKLCYVPIDCFELDKS